MQTELNILALLAVGFLTGSVSGMFGLGGGLIVVPFLTFFGIPAVTAVVTSVNQMTAGTLASFITYAKMKRVDYKMSALLTLGGLGGVVIGYILLKLVIASGAEELIIPLCFIVLISGIITSTSRDVIRVLRREEKVLEKTAHLERLPFKMSFIAHNVKLSAIPFILIGMAAGILVLFLGVGGGVFMIPVLLYFLHAKESYISGTIQLQMLFTSIIATILYSIESVPIDIFLSAILIFGTVIGSRFGAIVGAKLKVRRYRLFLAALLLLMSAFMLKNIFIAPNEIYQVYELLR